MCVNCIKDAKLKKRKRERKKKNICDIVHKTFS